MHMVKSGKRGYLNNLKSASSNHFWKAVKNLNGSQCTIPTLNHSGETATSDSEKATMLNNFSSCFNHSIPPISPSSGSERPSPIDCPPELLCTEDEVLELLRALLDTSMQSKWT